MNCSQDQTPYRIGATIRTGQEIQCLRYAGFFQRVDGFEEKNSQFEFQRMK